VWPVPILLCLVSLARIWFAVPDHPSLRIRTLEDVAEGVLDDLDIDAGGEHEGCGA
jgi:hypothetical protein